MDEGLARPLLLRMKRDTSINNSPAYEKLFVEYSAKVSRVNCVARYGSTSTFALGFVPLVLKISIDIVHLWLDSSSRRSYAEIKFS
jgi:hypothetical protein